MIRHYIFAGMALLSASAVFAADGQPVSFTVDNVRYEVMEGSSGQVQVSGLETSVDKLTFPAQVSHEGTTYSVYKIKEWAFMGETFTEMELPGGLQQIGAHAFSMCEKLKAIKVPASVNNIGEAAFMLCTAAESAEFSVYSIPEKCFSSCGALKDVTIPRLTGSIGNLAFSGCFALKEFKIAEGNSSFYLSDDGLLLKRGSRGSSPSVVVCPPGKEGRVTVPDGVGSINYGAFYGCPYVTEVSLPSSCNAIGVQGFMNCVSLESISLPDGLRYVQNEAFSGCSSLKEISLPDGITDNNLGESVFSMCSELTTVKLPSQLTFIPPNTFSLCYKLESVTYPENVTSVSIAAFNGAHAFGQQLPSTLTKIEESAYRGCGFKSVVIPESVTEIGEGAFADCLDLKDADVKASITSLPDMMFMNCALLENVVLPASLTGFGMSAFYNSGLKSFEVPATVTSLSDNLFACCKELETVTFEDQSTMKSFGESVFTSSGLKSFEVPAAITSLPVNTFSACDNLTELTFADADAFEEFGRFSVGYCSSLKNLTIPAGTKTISGFAFYQSNSLAEIKSEAVVPPVIVEESAFDAPVYENARLTVPEESADAYRTADIWKLFAHINEKEDGISSAYTDAVGLNVANGILTVGGYDGMIEIYLPSGQLIYSGSAVPVDIAGRGVVIVRIGTKAYKVNG